MTAITTDNDTRPRFAIGHLSMHAADVVALTQFYGRLGMRIVVEKPEFAILELRGGTHLVLDQEPREKATSTSWSATSTTLVQRSSLKGSKPARSYAAIPTTASSLPTSKATGFT